jgi:hypothetical protein
MPLPPRVERTGADIIIVSPLDSESLSLRHLPVKWFPGCEAALAFLAEHPAGVVISMPNFRTGAGKTCCTICRGWRIRLI